MDITLLRQSFALVVERNPELTHRFYEILFERHPQARALFGRNSGAAQEQMLTRALVAVVDHVDDPAWFTTTLEALGARHNAYGVSDEMYSWVGGALLATLAEVAGDDWTPAVAATWTAAYGAIAATMQAGARRALAAA